MATEEAAPPNSLRDPQVFRENEQIPAIVRTDAMHITLYGNPPI